MPLPYAPSRALYDPSDRSSAIVLRQGENAAESARRSGQIWGGAIQNLGGIATDAVGQYQENKAQQQISKNDAALLNYFEQVGDNWDPIQVEKIVGPDRARKVIEGRVALDGIRQKRGQEALQHLPGLVRGLNAVGEGGRAAMYAQIAPVVKQAGLFPAEAIPDQYDAESWKGISDFVSGMEKPKEESGFTLGEGQLRFGPDGKQIAAGPTAAPPVKTREIEVILPNGTREKRIVEDKPGQVFTSAAPPKEPKEPKTITVDGLPYRFNDDGTVSQIKIQGGGKFAGEAHPDGSNPSFIGQPGYENLNGAQKTSAASLNSLINTAKEYRKLINDTVDWTGVNLFGADSKDIQSSHGGILFTAAKAYEQGALQAPDKAVVEQIFSNPASWLSLPENVTKGGKAGQLSAMDKQIKNLEARLKDTYGLEARSQTDKPRPAQMDGNQPGPGASRSAPSGIITTPDGKKWKQVGGRMVEQR